MTLDFSGLTTRPGTAPVGAEVIDGGSRTTVQDLGRPGLAHVGVPRSGAADAPSLMLANRLVGNPEDAAGLETTLTGPTLRFLAAASIALAGAEVDATLDGRPQAMRSLIAVRPGQVLRIPTATSGLRTYLAVRGSVDVPHVLGSASGDQLTGLGPAPLKPGDTLAFGASALALPSVGIAAVPAPRRGIAHLRLGPRADRFAPDAITTLLTARWRATSATDRIGVRLDGPPLQLADDRPMRSEGMVLGSIQVPPSGQPIVMLADHPTTGGYPVIAVVDEPDVSVLAQLRPGAAVTFQLVPHSAPRGTSELSP